MEFNDSNFSGASFGRTQLHSTKFNGIANFTNATFQEPIFYSIQCFKKYISFAKAQFQGVSFADTIFEDQATFYQATFEQARFSHVVFNDKAFFTFVLFTDERRNLFDVDDFSKVSIQNTDITRVRFGKNVLWGKGLTDRFRVIDEKKLKEMVENPQPLLILFAWNRVFESGDEMNICRF
jgi:uncharacterized protein YjbI with pentapeptide repeats